MPCGFARQFRFPIRLHGYDLTGARVWFQFRASANGPIPEILYFNGRRVAMGEDLEPMVLFDDAKPGDKIVVAVKLLETVDVKTVPRRDAAHRFSREPSKSRGPGAGVSDICCVGT